MTKKRSAQNVQNRDPATLPAIAATHAHGSKCATPILACPPELTGTAREEWQRIIPLLVARDVVDELSRAPLIAYCRAVACAEEADLMIQKVGAVIKTPNGFPVISPYVSVLKGSTDTILRISSEFGFTPASRQRLRPSSGGDDFLDSFSTEPVW